MHTCTHGAYRRAREGALCRKSARVMFKAGCHSPVSNYSSNMSWPGLSEDPGLTTYFFLGVMGWGDGDSQVSRRRRRRTPGIIKICHVFITSRKSTISNFRTDFLVKNNPRRVRRRLAQRLYPVQRPKSTIMIKI